jgi:hypothetical protein
LPAFSFRACTTWGHRIVEAPAAAAEPAQICKNFLLVSVIVPSLPKVLGLSKLFMKLFTYKLILPAGKYLKFSNCFRNSRKRVKMNEHSFNYSFVSWFPLSCKKKVFFFDEFPAKINPYKA